MAKPQLSLRSLDLLEGGQNTSLENIAHLAAEILDAPTSLISVIQTSRNRQFVSAGCGIDLSSDETRAFPLEESICNLVYVSDQPLVIVDLQKDARTKNMNSVNTMGLRSYIGVPIHGVDGDAIGTLCCVTHEPRAWSTANVLTLTRLAQSVDDVIRYRAATLDQQKINAKLTKLLDARSSFTSHLSHEIRTPLTALVGSIKLLKAINPEGQIGELVGMMSRSSSRLLDIVNDSLDFAKLDSGQFKTITELCDLGDLARDVVSSFKIYSATKGLQTAVIDNLGGTQFMADKKALDSLMHNLFGNAVKFTHEGKAEIVLGYDQDGDVEIKVIDTGIGIEPSAHSLIFEEFQQANPRIARKYGGTGLGMAIVKRLVEIMHGEISLTSELGKGTTFTISLPLEIAKSTHSLPDRQVG